jgi:hypothetical protein
VASNSAFIGRPCRCTTVASRPPATPTQRWSVHAFRLSRCISHPVTRVTDAAQETAFIRAVPVSPLGQDARAQRRLKIPLGRRIKQIPKGFYTVSASDPGCVKTPKWLFHWEKHEQFARRAFDFRALVFEDSSKIRVRGRCAHLARSFHTAWTQSGHPIWPGRAVPTSETGAPSGDCRRAGVRPLVGLFTGQGRRRRPTNHRVSDERLANRSDLSVLEYGNGPPFLTDRIRGRRSTRRSRRIFLGRGHVRGRRGAR